MKRGILLLVVLVAAVGCSGNTAPGATDETAAFALKTGLGNDFAGNYIQVHGRRGPAADGKYPCLNEFTACLPLSAAGETPVVEDLCPSVDTPAGSWTFNYGLFTDAACATPLANIMCHDSLPESLEPGRNSNRNPVFCTTDNAGKSFDVCLYDPATGAGKDACAQQVLILSTTVTGGLTSAEASAAAALGFEPVVADPATWSALSTQQFGQFRAIVLGDPRCSGGLGAISPAEANAATWGPAVTGNVLVVGSDPAWHVANSGGSIAVNAGELIKEGIAFATSDPLKTGAYVSLSCYYAGAPAGTSLPLLDYFGDFEVGGVFGMEAAHVVGFAPALAGLTDASLSNWYNSIHEVFDKTPGSTFNAFAIAKNAPGSYPWTDGSVGVPYIVGRGITPVVFPQ